MSRLPWHQDLPCGCSRCQTLERLIRLVETPEPNTLVLKNVKLATNIQGARSVLVIDGSGSQGMQRVLDVDGQVKCLLCDEIAVGRAICSHCNDALIFIRELQRKLTVKGLKEMGEQLSDLSDSGLMSLLQLVTLDALKEWWKHQIQEIEIDSS